MNCDVAVGKPCHQDSLKTGQARLLYRYHRRRHVDFNAEEKKFSPSENRELAVPHFPEASSQRTILALTTTTTTSSTQILKKLSSKIVPTRNEDN